MKYTKNYLTLFRHKVETALDKEYFIAYNVFRK